MRSKISSIYKASNFPFTYVAVVLAAVFPKVAHGKLLANDHRASEDHHEADADDAARRVVERQRVVQHQVWNARQVVKVIHASAIKVESNGN